MIRIVLLIFAFVLFLLGAHLTSDLGTKLTRVGLALATAYVLLGPIGPIF